MTVPVGTCVLVAKGAAIEGWGKGGTAQAYAAGTPSGPHCEGLQFLAEENYINQQAIGKYALLYGPQAGRGNAGAVAAALDQAQVAALTTAAEREPSNAKPRVDLGNLYFDAERYSDAIRWYTDALMITPGDVDVSTDLGVCYYYTNEPDKALEQFAHSLKLSPNHTKTLLNLGIVKAFGKQDLEGATQAWQQVLKIAPDSPEGQAAKRAIDQGPVRTVWTTES